MKHYIKYSNKKFKSDPIHYNPVAVTINKALSGDTIILPKGTLYSNGFTTNGKTLTIQGMGRGKTILKPNRGYGAISCSRPSDLVIQDLTIEVPRQSSGIFALNDYTGYITLKNVEIRCTDRFRKTPQESRYLLCNNPVNGTSKVIWTIEDSIIESARIAGQHISLIRSTIGDVRELKSKIESVTDIQAIDSILSNVSLEGKGANDIHLQNTKSYGGLEIRSGAYIDHIEQYAYGLLDESEESLLTSFKKSLNINTNSLDQIMTDMKVTNYFALLQVTHNRKEKIPVTVKGPIAFHHNEDPNAESLKQMLFFVDNAEFKLTDANLPSNCPPTVFKNTNLTFEDTAFLSPVSIDNQSKAMQSNSNLPFIKSPAQPINHSTTEQDSQAAQAGNTVVSKAPEIKKSGITKLNELIGLETAKTLIKQMISNAALNRLRQQRGIGKVNKMSLHSIFLGNAGTGKTTVARLFAEALYEKGVIRENKLIECSPKDLIAGYVGQTQAKTHEKIQEAIGGVLFIDEAYELRQKNGNGFQSEATSQLIADMENHRDDLIVILAGYEDEMNDYINNDNPGLKSRFTNKVYFDDYNFEELNEIMGLTFNNHKSFPDSKRTLKVVQSGLNRLYHMALKYDGKNYGNGRFVRNYVERVEQMRDLRLVNTLETNQEPSDADLLMYTEKDVIDAVKYIQKTNGYNA